MRCFQNEYKYTESCCLLVSPHRMRTITESKIFFEKTDSPPQLYIDGANVGGSSQISMTIRCN